MNRRRYKRKSYGFVGTIILLAFLIVKSGLLNYIPAEYNPFIKTTANKEIEAVIITHISDGDTISVKLEDKTKKVRFIGIDTPESVHVDSSKNTKWGKTASNYTKKQLSVGQMIYLTKDKSDTDRYGRLLRFIWTSKPDDVTDISNTYNAKLLKDGMARAAAYEPDTTYKRTLQNLADKARSNKIGLWADSGYCNYIDNNFN